MSIQRIPWLMKCVLCCGRGAGVETGAGRTEAEIGGRAGIGDGAWVGAGAGAQRMSVMNWSPMSWVRGRGTFEGHLRNIEFGLL